MNSRQIVQYTIRDIPAKVDHALRQQAYRLHKSLNEVVKETLTKAVGLAQTQPLHHDLDHFFGSWIEDQKLKRSLQEQRAIDQYLWK